MDDESNNETVQHPSKLKSALDRYEQSRNIQQSSVNNGGVDMTWSRNYNFEPVPMRHQVVISNNKNVSLPNDQTTSIENDDESNAGKMNNSKNASTLLEHQFKTISYP